MVSPYVLAGTFGLPLADVEKPALPELFHIDDLLDFSCEDIGGPIVGGELQLSGVTVEKSQSATGGETSISSSTEAKSELVEAVPVETEAKTDLCVPCDDLADLEWLSSFVEDSFTMVDTRDVFSQYGGFASGERTTSVKLSDPYQKSSPVSVLETSATSSELTGQDYRDVSVPGRARSKRSRTGARIWTSRILPTSSSANSFESMGADSYAMSYSPIESEDASGESTVDVVEQEDEDSQCSKRYKLTSCSHSQNSMIISNNSNSTHKGRKKNLDNAQPWRCMHCQTQRTPQWRTGPMGPKTLCNACGVRYKSGRLLPEYRPAGSPTYVASKHSHSHKKVLEMRRERELKGQHHPQGHHVHQQPLHGVTPLREKTNTQKEQGVKSSMLEHVKSEYQSYGSKSLEMQKCFSKPLELPRPPKLEMPKYETNTTGLEFSKCLTSTTAVLGSRLDFGLDDSSMRDMRGL